MLKVLKVSDYKNQMPRRAVSAAHASSHVHLLLRGEVSCLSCRWVSFFGGESISIMSSGEVSDMAIPSAPSVRAYAVIDLLDHEA